MNFNFFDWIRDGVKRSVLLGVSDAVDTMGAPPDEAQTKDQMLCFLQESGTKATARKRVTASAGNSSGGSGGTSTRKLGRTMKEIQASTKTS